MTTLSESISTSITETSQIIMTERVFIKNLENGRDEIKKQRDEIADQIRVLKEADEHLKKQDDLLEKFTISTRKNHTDLLAKNPWWCMANTPITWTLPVFGATPSTNKTHVVKQCPNNQPQNKETPCSNKQSHMSRPLGFKQMAYVSLLSDIPE
jgi:hypothetical protein